MEYHKCGAGHSISPADCPAAVRWLTAAFGENRSPQTANTKGW
jgi:hypothetical protein